MIELQSQHSDIKKAIIRSQHCQRNWDLTKEIPQEDLELIEYSVTQCPSKQNVAYYKVHMITNRNIIEQIYENTDGFIIDPETLESETNSQTLANLLIVFESYNGYLEKNEDFRNLQIWNLHECKDVSKDNLDQLKRDQQMAVGIAAGYANIISSMLGYGTGCCACFNSDAIKEILDLDDKILLMMGIGFKDSSRNRREHHKTGFIFPTKKKQEIKTKRYT